MARLSKPGFVDTLRHGWKPPQRRAGQGSSNGSDKSPGGPTVGNSDLVKQRERLSREFAELQWDLGGLTYEMASRDHFRLDVLNRQAAELQKIDAELGQIERMLKLDEQGAAGTCPNCGSLQARGAHYCWQCGKELTAPSPASGSTGQPAS